jgi:DNA-binding HxlR family transcriptional regulator
MTTQENIHCPVARSTSMIGDRWSLLILRDLLQLDRCRFQGLAESLHGIAPNTLSTRLKSLEANGIVEREFYETHPPRAEYVLTEKGRNLGPVIKALDAWGKQYCR